MLIMTQDRVSGLASDKSPLKTYGPGNTRDDSNRNSWVSSDGTDKLTINCLGQVNGLFLGRYQADEVLLTYQGDDLFQNKTSSGYISIGYGNNSTGVLTGTVTAIESVPGGYYYNSGSLITITLNQNTDYINVNDLIRIFNNSTSFLNGNHRVVQVQKASSFTRLNGSGNSALFQEQGAVGEKIQVIINRNISDIQSLLNTTLSLENGLSISLLTAGNISGTIEDENDIAFTYKVGFSISASDLLKSGESPFTVGEYISFEDCKIETSIGSLLSENLDYSVNSYTSYYVERITEDQLGFDVFVKPGTFYSKNLVQVTTSGSPKVNLGSTFFYNGGGYQHKLGIGLIAGSSSTAGTDIFENTEVLELSSPTVSTQTFNTKQITLNSIEQTYLHKTTIKDRAQFSIKLPFKAKGGSPLANLAFLFGSGDSIEIRKYVVDTTEASTTTGGEGTPIRRTSIATRTQNTVADFVTGKLIRVESNYIPLPREAFPTKILIEMNATLNHNAANLFNQFLLEEIYLEKPSSSASNITTSLNSELSNSTYYDSVSTYLYNSNDNGELTLNFSAGTSLVAGDYIYLNWPSTVPAQNDQISKTLTNVVADHTATKLKFSNTIHELYVGMKVAGTSDVYILTINKTANEITTNIAHGVDTSNVNSVTVNVTFDHHPDLGDDASSGWTGIHRVKTSENSGQTIKLIVPNSGVNGDLTINSNAGLKAATGVYAIKVKNGKGRFVRPITTSITSADAFLWNSGTSTVTYSYGGQSYDVEAETAQLIFSSPHSLVNNDKIVLYDLASSSGGTSLRGLDSSYLVTYSTSNIVKIALSSSSSIVISSLGSQLNAGADNDLLVITSTDHGFSVGDKVTLNNLPSSPTDYSGFYTIKTTPTSKSFTVDVGSDVASNYNPTVGASARAIVGVHYLTSLGGTVYTNSTSTGNITGVPCSRSVSIADAISSFENPIEVGNLIYRDALQFSSGVYQAANVSSATFSKTPNIDDATSTSPYRPDSDTAIQNTFAGTADSVVSQINLIRGDATTQFDIHLEKPFGKLNTPFVFTKLLQGLKVAIVRAGISRQLPNPQVGVSNNMKDFSVRKELPTGAYYYLNRDSAKEFSGRLLSDPESVDQIIDFGAEQLARPFPCLVISGNTGNMKKLRTRTALYGYFTALPQATFSNKLNNLKEASFSIREVL